jgi:hypothetical protein
VVWGVKYALCCAIELFRFARRRFVGDDLSSSNHGTFRTTISVESRTSLQRDLSVVRMFNIDSASVCDPRILYFEFVFASSLCLQVGEELCAIMAMSEPLSVSY